MKFGLTYTARSTAANIASDPGQPDDAEEEFDTPETIEAIATALRWLGHEVELLGDGNSLVRRLLSAPPPEFVFNIAEGRGIGRSREAWTPALLEMFCVPYTGSDPLTLAATLDKDCAKRLVASAGVAVPKGVLIDGVSDDFVQELGHLPLPLIVKPAFEGSSKGIRSHSLVNCLDDVNELVEQCRDAYQQPVLVEEFIDGDELTVGIVGNSPPEIIGIMRVVPLSNDRPFVYSLEVKRDWRRQVRYETPAQLSQADETAVRHAVLAAFKVLGCRDVARIDFRLRCGVPYFLEANPLPGLTPGSSDLVLLAEAVGIGYRDLIARIVDTAISRHSTQTSVAAAT